VLSAGVMRMARPGAETGVGGVPYASPRADGRTCVGVSDVRGDSGLLRLGGDEARICACGAREADVGAGAHDGGARLASAMHMVCAADRTGVDGVGDDGGGGGVVLGVCV
jgi:hypothetical protein